MPSIIPGLTGQGENSLCSGLADLRNFSFFGFSAYKALTKQSLVNKTVSNFVDYFGEM